METLRTIIKDWLTNSRRTDRSCELYYNFPISEDCTQIVNFLSWIPDCDSHSPDLLDLFIYSDVSICSKVAFLPLVSTDFSPNLQGDAPFHYTADDYSHADWNSLCGHLRYVSWEDIFKLGASTAASEFCEWSRLEVMSVSLPHRKYQVKSHSSPYFIRCLNATAIA